MPESLLLHEFGEMVSAAFDGAIPYHVGSSLKKKRGWRDVDVRLLLANPEYAAMGFGHPERPHSSAKWRAFVRAFSALGRQMTGLPIDFQIQQQSWANKNYGRAKGHQRSALFVSCEGKRA